MCSSSDGIVQQIKIKISFAIQHWLATLQKILLYLVKSDQKQFKYQETDLFSLFLQSVTFVQRGYQWCQTV